MTLDILIIVFNFQASKVLDKFKDQAEYSLHHLELKPISKSWSNKTIDHSFKVSFIIQLISFL